MQNDQSKGQREGWDIEKLGDEASQKNTDEIQRETLRGDETQGNPDERDIVGNVDTNETWQGREEAKNDIGDKANANG